MHVPDNPADGDADDPPDAAREGHDQHAVTDRSSDHSGGQMANEKHPTTPSPTSTEEIY